MSSRLAFSRLLVLSLLLLLLLSTLSPTSAQRKNKAKTPKKPNADASARPPTPPTPPAAASGDVEEQLPAPVTDPKTAAKKVGRGQADESIAPPVQGPRGHGRFNKPAGGKAQKQGSKLKKGGPREPMADNTNGWLADIADADNVPYLLNIGTERNNANVIADDHTQPAYQPHIEAGPGEPAPADDTTGEIGDVAEMFLWRRQTDDELAGGKARSITMQRPMAFVQDDELLDVAVQGWGTRSIRLLPVLSDMNAEPIVISLVSSCKKAGTTYVNIALRLFEMTAGARSRKNIEFSVKRTCSASNSTVVSKHAAGGKAGATDKAGAAEAAPVDVTIAASHFDIDLLDAKDATQAVVVHGQAQPAFRSRAKDSKEQDASLPLYAVPTARSRIDLSIRYTGSEKRTLNKPVVYVESSTLR